MNVAWGRPYFRSHLPRLRDGRRFPEYLPVDLMASRRLGRRVPVLVDAVRFPSDPETTRLESNDLVVLLQSDVRSNVTTARERLLAPLKGVLEPTSIRHGFVGAGLPKRFATAAGRQGDRPRPARRRVGLQQHPADDAPPELPRATAGASRLSAR